MESEYKDEVNLNPEPKLEFWNLTGTLTNITFNNNSYLVELMLSESIKMYKDANDKLIRAISGV